MKYFQNRGKRATSKKSSIQNLKQRRNGPFWKDGESKLETALPERQMIETCRVQKRIFSEKSLNDYVEKLEQDRTK